MTSGPIGAELPASRGRAPVLADIPDRRRGAQERQGYVLTQCPKTALFPALSWWSRPVKGGIGLKARDSWEARALATTRRNAQGSAAASSAARLESSW